MCADKGKTATNPGEHPFISFDRPSCLKPRTYFVCEVTAEGRRQHLCSILLQSESHDATEHLSVDA